MNAPIPPPEMQTPQQVPDHEKMPGAFWAFLFLLFVFALACMVGTGRIQL